MADEPTTPAETPEPKVITFDDLTFYPHRLYQNAKQAAYLFPNGYGVSVIQGERTAGDPDANTYEVMVMKSDGTLAYHTGLCIGPIPNRAPEQVSHFMAMVQGLPPRGGVDE